jgi:hypothetical protein
MSLTCGNRSNLALAGLDAAPTACILLAWLMLLALANEHAKAEPKTLRVLHPARVVNGGRVAEPENRRDLALGRREHHCLAPHPGHLTPHLTITTSPADQGKAIPGHAGPTSSYLSVLFN